ncbi:hypothetical protein [Halobacillus campisalis]|uniref:Uncharacterized protein n=1 Tax=Halobacillus campisalis TaxID=435909 RepID=A0ABW2K404_9BACI
MGTTIVPYTLFLQSSVVQERFKGEEELKDSRFDVVTTISIRYHLRGYHHYGCCRFPFRH